MIYKEHLFTEHKNAKLTCYIHDIDKHRHNDIMRPAIIICPGGGYQLISSKEGEPIALAYAAKGYCTFVLHYSVGIDNPFPIALKQLGAAVQYVRENSSQWNIDTNDITLVGFSAGGHLAACLGVFFDQDFLCKELNVRKDDIVPNALVLAYPAITLIEWNKAPADHENVTKTKQEIIPDMRGIDINQILSGKLDVTTQEKEYFNLTNHVSKNTPKTFLWGSNSDTVIHPSDLWGFAEKLRENNVSYELHIFDRGSHAQGLSDKYLSNDNAQSQNHLQDWFSLSLKWLNENRNKK